MRKPTLGKSLCPKCGERKKCEAKTCRSCYERDRVRPPAERFWAKVKKTDTCWLWEGTTWNGYGQVFVNTARGSVPAHRFAYELLVDSIPDGLQIDHLCRNPCCVNPEHLEPVTKRENVLRGVGASAQNTRKTHCIRGHEFSGANLYLHPDGYRVCRACKALLERGYKAKRYSMRRVKG